MRHPSRGRRSSGTLVARGSAVFVVCSLAAACSNAPDRRSGRVDPRYGVSASARVVQDGEPVPKGGGRAQVGKPYTIGGRTYVPREDPNYDRSGIASWYGADFHGRQTANGEVYDRRSLSAAHPTMPLPSYARVTNLQNGRSVVVRVNDRGPYAGNREIDLSEKTAEVLGFKHRGLTDIRVQYVGPAPVEGSDDATLLATLTQGTPSLDRDRTLVARAPAAAAPTRPVQVAQAGTGTASWRPAPGRAVGPDDDGETPRRYGRPAQRPVQADEFPSGGRAPTWRGPVRSEDDDEDDFGAPAPGYGRPVGADHPPPGYRGPVYQFRPGPAGYPLSYAADPSTPRAAAAKEALTQVGDGPGFAALAGKAQAPGRTVTIDLGAYADPANADRLAEAMRPHGTVSVRPMERSDGRRLLMVRLDVEAGAADGALAAATRAGVVAPRVTVR